MIDPNPPVVGKATQAVRKLYSRTPETESAFAVGFACGQAEKVYLGVCRAAMFRPAAENFEWYTGEVEKVAAAYGLAVVVLESHCPESPWEIWIARDESCVGGWVWLEANSPQWHQERAAVCGIPEREVDVNYHRRAGYGEKCD